MSFVVGLFVIDYAVFILNNVLRTWVYWFEMCTQGLCNSALHCFSSAPQSSERLCQPRGAIRPLCRRMP